MPLPSGTWKMNVNGFLTDLQIQPTQGELFTATLADAGLTFRGFWNEASQSVSFGLPLGEQSVILFEGYAFRTPITPEPGQDVVVTLAGVVRVNTGASFTFLQASARRNVFGWFAQITELI
ncbi:MAG TPA: hypothetical protein VJM12_08785 [Pyrinomonadaceae bacterium]|nr:hypothetical protein [Pyrinomonadaceae bacterium]